MRVRARKILMFAVALIAAAALLLCGCSSRAGADGRDGNDLTIYGIYEAYRDAVTEEGGEPMSFLDFLDNYLNIEYTGSELDSALSLQASINRSLMSAVDVVAFYPNGTRLGVVSGSGVITDIDRENGDAYIVTNCHIIYDDGESSIYPSVTRVFLYGQEDYDYDYSPMAGYTIEGGIDAEIVASSVAYDLALLKVTDSEEIRESYAVAAEWADGDVAVGETVYAVGNPGGYGMSVTTGIVSVDVEYIGVAFSASMDRYYRVMRTDCAVNSGNSGGGLFNAEGKLVGIINAKDGSEDSENVGYALPASCVERVVRSMKDTDDNDPDTVQEGIYRAVFGVALDTESRPSYIDGDGMARRREAVYVEGLDSSVKGYGWGELERNDLITHIRVESEDGEIREDCDADMSYRVTDAVISARRGDTVTFTVRRSVKDGYEDIDIPIYIDDLSGPGVWENLAAERGPDILWYI